MQDRWEPSELDLKWAEQEASNWMYSEHLEYDKDEHHVVTSCLLFGLQRLGIHVAEKAEHPNPAWMALFVKTPEPMPMTACRYGYEYALQHIPVEI